MRQTVLHLRFPARPWFSPWEPGRSTQHSAASSHVGLLPPATRWGIGFTGRQSKAKSPEREVARTMDPDGVALDEDDAERRARNFSDEEAHCAIAIMRYYAGWRKTPVREVKWGVREERVGLLHKEVARLIDAIRAVP